MSFPNDINLSKAMEIPGSNPAYGENRAPVSERDKNDFQRALEREQQRGETSGKSSERDIQGQRENPKGDQSVRVSENSGQRQEPYVTNRDNRSPEQPKGFEKNFEREGLRESEAFGKTDEKMRGSEAAPRTGIESLFSQMSSPVETLTQPAEAAPAPEAKPMSTEQLETLVSRILVSSPEKGSTEVRLTLGDNVLKGTEISIVRDSTGALSVKIQCTDPASFQTLVASRNDLVDALKSQEKAPVDVQMNNTDEQRGQEDDRQRRSQGLVQDEYGNYI